MEIVLLKELLKGKMDLVYFIDDTFTAFPERVLKFIDISEKNNLNVPWRCESRIDVMTGELIKSMAEGGCRGIVYGIESGSQEILDKIRKKIDLNHVRNIIKYTCDTGMKLSVNFMIGHYCDTIETMKETVDFIREIYENFGADIALTYNTPYPGTWQYTHRDELGINIITDDYSQFTIVDPIVETKNFTVKDQLDISLKAVHYILNNSPTYEEVI